MSRQIVSLLAIAAVAVTLAPTAASAAPTPKAPVQAAPVAQAKAKAVDCAQLKCIALTFDDGPGKYAGTLLDTLKKYNAKATFFSKAST